MAINIGVSQNNSWNIGLSQNDLYLGIAWGEENPDETPESWDTWDDGAAGAINIEGDPDWGTFMFEASEIGHGPVKDLGDADTKIFMITLDKYGTGSGVPTVYIRGSATTFSQDDGSPSWEEYTVPTQKEWRYVQVKLFGP